MYTLTTTIFLLSMLFHQNIIPYGASALALPRADASREEVGNAVNRWVKDTTTVSQFLNDAHGLSGKALVNRATVALDAENDELVHKTTLEKYIGDTPSVGAANHTLVQRQTFQFVVDSLEAFVNDGTTYTHEVIQTLVDEINHARCGQVLPAIDAYMVQSAEILKKWPQNVRDPP